MLIHVPRGGRGRMMHVRARSAKPDGSVEVTMTVIGLNGCPAPTAVTQGIPYGQQP